MSRKNADLKYIKVCDFIRKEIGDKLPSCRELAETLGVSYLTVTNAMRFLKDEGLISCVTRQGNFIAEARRHDSVPGVRTGLMMDTRGHLYQDFFSAATAELMAQNIYWIPLGEAGTPEIPDAGKFRVILQKYAEMGIKNLVINGHRRFPYRYLNDLSDKFEQIIYAIQYEAASDAMTDGANIIIPDYRRAGRLAAEYLLENGWEEISFITYEPVDESERRVCGTTRNTEDMLVMDGIEEVLRENGCQGLIEIISESPYQKDAPETESKIHKALSRKKTAFAAMGDIRYKRIAETAEKNGLKQGRDFGFVGMYNTPWADAWNFSSISLREDKLAKLTVQALSEGWKNRRVEIEPELIVRPGKN